MPVAENLDECVRVGISQRLERGQGKNKIANRAAADDENPVQSSVFSDRQRNDKRSAGHHGAM